MTKHYYRIALFAHPQLGLGSFSWRVKEALEALGNTVFFFSPLSFPEAFDQDGHAKASVFKRFFLVQQLDCVIVADGVEFDFNIVEDLPSKTAYGALCETSDIEERYRKAVEEGSFHFVVICDGSSLWLLEREKEAVIECCRPVVDEAYALSPLANDIAFGPGVLCLQDATEERKKTLELVAAQNEGVAIRCFGNGWNSSWRMSGRHAEYVYASRSSIAVVVFADADFDQGKARGKLTDAALSLPLADGCPVLVLGNAPFPSFWRDRVLFCEDEERMLREITHAHESYRPARTRVCSPLCDFDGKSLEQLIGSLFEKLRGRLACQGIMVGSENPRSVVCVMGYFGKGNFGDEYILMTLDKRLRSFNDGVSVVAVSEDPLHTLEKRGIFSIGLRDAYALDNTLMHASLALVVAGLLFDQGIRWTMGKAELISSLEHSDIPGIAAFALLARLNEARTVLYGIGAGPLEVDDSKRLVRLMADIDSLFITRDNETADVLALSNVPESQILRKADTAFLGCREETETVAIWISENAERIGNAKLFAVSLRTYECLPPDFPRRIAHSLDTLANRHADIRFVFCILDQDDESLAHEVMELMASRETALLFNPGDDIEAMEDMISRCYAGLSMRYHCSLLLNRSGKPCVGLDYLPKVSSLYKDMGCSELLLSPQASEAEILSAIFAMLDDYRIWQDTVTKNVKRLTALSLEAEDVLRNELGSSSKRATRIKKTFYLENVSCSDRSLLSSQDQLRSCREELDSTLADRNELRNRCIALEDELRGIKNSRSFKLATKLAKLARILRR